MTTRCPRNPKPNRVKSAGRPVAAALVGVSVVLLGASFGCVNFAESAPGVVQVDLVAGEVVVGNLFTNQTLRATATVEAGHTYELGAILTATLGTVGSGPIEGTISGGPLTAPVTFSVTTTGEAALGSVGGTLFVAQGDGEVVITFSFPASGEGGSVSDTLQSLRNLINGPVRGTYGLLLTDWGVDDNGTSPEDGLVLAVGPEGERSGALTPVGDSDYFLLLVQADVTYQLNLEATGSVNLSSGTEDRFGQVNFGVPSPGGLLITASASAGVPGAQQFTALAGEEIVLRLTSSGANSSTFTAIQYALSVIEVIPEVAP